MSIYMDSAQGTRRLGQWHNVNSDNCKTRRCSGFGENVADTIAKGDMISLSKMGLQNATWSRPSRVLMDWVKKPVVTPSLGKMLLDELSAFMDVIIPDSCTA